MGRLGGKKTIAESEAFQQAPSCSSSNQSLLQLQSRRHEGRPSVFLMELAFLQGEENKSLASVSRKDVQPRKDAKSGIW